MANAKLDLIEKEVNALLEKIEADKVEATSGMDKALSALKDAEANVEESFNAQNVELYKKNVALKNDAEVGLSMYRDKLDQLNRTSYITESEFNKYCSDIIAELDKELRAGKKTVVDAIDSFMPIRDKLVEDIKRANKLLKTLQVEVYKDQNYISAPNVIIAEKALKKIDDYTLVQLINRLESLYMYQQMRESNV